jgi:hypothetical protein
MTVKAARPFGISRNMTAVFSANRSLRIASGIHEHRK